MVGPFPLPTRLLKLPITMRQESDGGALPLAHTPSKTGLSIRANLEVPTGAFLLLSLFSISRVCVLSPNVAT